MVCINDKVKHLYYGSGTVVDVCPPFVTVLFNSGKQRNVIKSEVKHV